MEVINAVEHPDQPRNETVQHIITDWIGEGWDYSKFSVEEANGRIRKTFHRSRQPTAQ